METADTKNLSNLKSLLADLKSKISSTFSDVTWTDISGTGFSIRKVYPNESIGVFEDTYAFRINDGLGHMIYHSKDTLNFVFVEEYRTFKKEVLEVLRKFSYGSDESKVITSLFLKKANYAVSGDQKECKTRERASSLFLEDLGVVIPEEDTRSRSPSPSTH